MKTSSSKFLLILSSTNVDNFFVIDSSIIEFEIYNLVDREKASYLFALKTFRTFATLKPFIVLLC